MGDKKKNSLIINNLPNSMYNVQSTRAKTNPQVEIQYLSKKTNLS